MKKHVYQSRTIKNGVFGHLSIGKQWKGRFCEERRAKGGGRPSQTHAEHLVNNRLFRKKTYSNQVMF